MIRSLITAIGIFRMLQVPQGATARDYRNRRKVIGWGRGRYRPFERPCVPGIVTSSDSLEIRKDEVCHEHKNREGLDKRADRNDEVQSIPTPPWLIGVDPAGHAKQSGNVHDVERQVKADEEEPEVPFAEALTQHSASHFRIPVI